MGKREGDMGCYPLRRMMSKAFGRCNGDERRRHSTKMIYTPPPTYSHTRTVKSVTFSNDNPIIVIPPEHDNGSTIPKYYPEHSRNLPKHYPESVLPPTAHASSSSNGYGAKHADPKESDRNPSAPQPDPPDNIHPTPIRHEPMASYHGPVHGYAPSPLPRWEDGARRQEYFGSEYNYYPTPIREGIYNIAADPNRLTAMFSEENPNACTIV
ncbi:putative early nodulin-75 [Iris pallida]|uniref:Early nodulin-75 n=1 Tax=Iris pallida TaxID=29817 RepID=A0AAX6EUX5_IRIPA|nr:putative early nodulin-75 [Iris pallida]KAJ6828279.1 putative early nodulin-75 [Iris pallida]KAJ6829965.1 putative early nodulin-75 [Iris pallida]